MSTTFTVRVAGKDGLQWSVDLGSDILEGLTDAQIRGMAEDSAIIALQGKIRKGVKSDDAESVEKFVVKQGFVNAYVEKHEATESENALAKKLIKILGKEKAMEIIAEHQQ